MKLRKSILHELIFLLKKENKFRHSKLLDLNLYFKIISYSKKLLDRLDLGEYCGQVLAMELFNFLRKIVNNRPIDLFT